MAPTKPDQITPSKPGSISARKGRRNAAGVPYHQSPDKVGKVTRARDLQRIARLDPRDAKKHPIPKKFQVDFQYRPVEYEDGDVKNPLKGNRPIAVDDGKEYEDDDEIEDKDYEEEEMVAAGLASARKKKSKRPRYEERPTEDKGVYWINPNGVMIRVDPKAPWKPTAYNDMATAGQKYPVKEPGVVDPNGRNIGRHLVNWHRPRMMEKLLLCIQYECHREGLLIPWDKIVHRLNPGSSGPSAVQMLCKMREVLITEGHFIPPSLGKRSMMIDPRIRGFTRDKDRKEPWAARTVSWLEEIDHPKENEVGNGVIRGSGKYRLATAEQVAEITELREEIEGPLARPAYPMPGMRNGPPAGSTVARNIGKSHKTPIKSRFSKKVVDEDLAEIDPDDNDPDSDYSPAATRRQSRRPIVRARRSRHSPIVVEESDDESDDASPPARRISIPHPPTEVFNGGPVIRPNRRQSPSTKEEYDSDGVPAPTRRRRGLVLKVPAAKSASSSRQPSSTPSDSIGKISYQGPEEHGTISQFSKAIKDGKNPSMNGTRYQSRDASDEDEMSVNDDTEPEVETPHKVGQSLTDATNNSQMTPGGLGRLHLDSPASFTSPGSMYPYSMTAPVSATLAANMAYAGVDANFRPISSFGNPTSFASSFAPLSHPVFGGPSSGFASRAERPFAPLGFSDQTQGWSMLGAQELKSENSSANGFLGDNGSFSQSSSTPFSQSSATFSHGNDGLSSSSSSFSQANTGGFEQSRPGSSSFMGHDSQGYGFGGYDQDHQDHMEDVAHHSHFEDALDTTNNEHELLSPSGHGSPQEYTEF